MVAALVGGRVTACAHVHLSDLTGPMKSAAASSSYDSEPFESYEGSRRAATPHVREGYGSNAPDIIWRLFGREAPCPKLFFFFPKRKQATDT